jgi:hypothetical protein
MKLLPAVCLQILVLAATLNAEELLKPVGGSGAGPVVEGLQATVRAVKEEFGPGESVLLQWTLQNVGEQEREIVLDKNRTLVFFAFEVRREGNEYDLGPREVTEPVQVRKILQPGAKVEQWIDLRRLRAADPKWLDARGRYEVAVVYRGANVGRDVRSGWATFRVAPMGTPMPPPVTSASSPRSWT